MTRKVPYPGSLGMLQGTLYAIMDGQQSVEILMEHHWVRHQSPPLLMIMEKVKLQQYILMQESAALRVKPYWFLNFSFIHCWKYYETRVSNFQNLMLI